MLSERHYEFKALKQLDPYWLTIKNPEISVKYDTYALKRDKEGGLTLGFLAIANTLFNICLCLFFPEQTFSATYVPLAFLIIAFFVMHLRVEKKPWLINITGPLALLCLCLATGSHELNRQTMLY